MQSEGRVVRILVFFVSLSLSLAGVGFAITAAMQAVDLGKPAINFNIANITARRLPALAKERAEVQSPLYQVAVFGDSTVVSYARAARSPIVSWRRSPAACPEVRKSA